MESLGWAGLVLVFSISFSWFFAVFFSYFLIFDGFRPYWKSPNAFRCYNTFSVPFLSLSVILWAISVEEIENVGTLIYPPVAELDSIWSCLDSMSLPL